MPEDELTARQRAAMAAARQRPPWLLTALRQAQVSRRWPRRAAPDQRVAVARA